MSGLHPTIKLVTEGNPAFVKIKNSDNLEAETINTLPPGGAKQSIPTKPPMVSNNNSNVPMKRENVFQKPKSVNGAEGLEYLLNPTKQQQATFSVSDESESQESGIEYYDEEGEEDQGEEYYEGESCSEDASNYQQQPPKRSPKPFQTPKQLAEAKKIKKQDMLTKLLALKNRGVELTRNYDMNSSYSDIEFEYYSQKRILDGDAAVKFQKQVLLAAVTGIEFLNKKFDPIGAKLNGWSESVMDSIEDYDSVFRRLYEKYSSRSELPPEIELLVLLVGGAFMFHMTNVFFEQTMGPMTQDANSKPIPNAITDSIANIMRENQNQNQNNTTQNNQVNQMSAPSVNLSSMINETNHSKPISMSSNLGNKMNLMPPPEVRMNFDKNEDRFSIGSSETIRSATKAKNSNKKGNTQAIKTINI